MLRALIFRTRSFPTESLSMDEEREACRALRGSILRLEIYADDAGVPPTPSGT